MGTPLTQGQIGKIYKDALAPVLYKYENMEVIRITKDYHLLPDGHVKEEVDLTFNYNGNDDLTIFPWHIPFASETTQVLGVRVRPGTKVKGMTSSHLDNMQLLEIQLDSVKKGEFVHLFFEYFITGASTFSQGLFFNKIHYPMAFVPADTLDSIDIRVHVPGKRFPESDINLTKFFSVSVNGKQTLLTSQEGNLVGDISGNVSVRYKNTIHDGFLSIFIGLAFSSLLTFFPDLKPALGEWWYVLVTGVTLLTVGAAYKLLND